MVLPLALDRWFITACVLAVEKGESRFELIASLYLSVFGRATTVTAHRLPDLAHGTWGPAASANTGGCGCEGSQADCSGPGGLAHKTITRRESLSVCRWGAPPWEALARCCYMSMLQLGGLTGQCAAGGASSAGRGATSVVGNNGHPPAGSASPRTLV